MKSFVHSFFGLAVLAVLTFAGSQLFHIPLGNMNDWIIGVLVFFWLLAITVIPWNIYFEAKEVLDEAEKNKLNDQEIKNPQEVLYAKGIADKALNTAIALHGLTAAGLFAVAEHGLSNIGYFGAGGSVLLSFLRPSVRLYEYIKDRLKAIKQQITHPREDLLTWKRELLLTKGLSELNLKDNKNLEGLVKELGKQIKALREDLEAQQKVNEQTKREQAEQIQSALSRLSADSKFMQLVREVVALCRGEEPNAEA